MIRDLKEVKEGATRTCARAIQAEEEAEAGLRPYVVLSSLKLHRDSL